MPGDVDAGLVQVLQIHSVSLSINLSRMIVGIENRHIFGPTLTRDLGDENRSAR